MFLPIQPSPFLYDPTRLPSTILPAYKPLTISASSEASSNMENPKKGLKLKKTEKFAAKMKIER